VQYFTRVDNKRPPPSRIELTMDEANLQQFLMSEAAPGPTWFFCCRKYRLCIGRS